MPIEILNLNLTLGACKILRDVNLKLEKGQIYSLLGTNGTGENTTISVVTGLRAPTGAAVRALGLAPASPKARCGDVVDFLFHGARKKPGANIIKNVRGADWMVDKPV